MKVNIHCGDKTREGYSNFDIRASGDTKLKQVKDYSMIQCSANEIEEMVAHAGTLESMTRSEIPERLKSWYERIKPGGSLKLSFIESKKIATSYSYNNMDLVSYESHISSCKSLHSMFEVRNTLIALGFKIKTSDFSINDYIGTIHAEK